MVEISPVKPIWIANIEFILIGYKQYVGAKSIKYSILLFNIDFIVVITLSSLLNYRVINNQGKKFSVDKFYLLFIHLLNLIRDQFNRVSRGKSLYNNLSKNVTPYEK